MISSKENEMYPSASTTHPNCKKCKLHQTCTSPFMSCVSFKKTSRDTPRVLVVGEAPGATEDRENRPFIGKAGQILRKQLRTVLGSLAGVTFSNAVRCRPQNNKLSSEKPIKLCRIFLEADIQRLRPDYILLLGNTALASVLEQDHITTNRRKIMEYLLQDGTSIPTVAALHPAAVLYDEKNRKKFAGDIAFLGNVIKNKDKTVEEKLLQGANLDASARDIRKFHKRARELNAIVLVDVESNSLYPYALGKHFSLLCVGLTCAGQTIVVRCDRLDPDKKVMVDADPVKTDALQKLLRDAKVKKAGHNIKYDMHASAEWFGVEMRNVAVDSLALDSMLRPSEVAHDLKSLASKHLGVGEYDLPLKKAKEQAKKIAAPYLKEQAPEMNSWAFIPYQLLARYNALDCATNSKILEAQRKTLLEEDKKHARFLKEPSGAYGMKPSVYFKKVVMPSIRFLFRMERTGMLVDIEYTKQLQHDTEEHLNKLGQTLRLHPYATQLQLDRADELFSSEKSPKTEVGKQSALAKLVFNPGSDQQVGSLLFGEEYFGLTPGYREVSEKTQRPSVGREILERHAAENEGSDVATFINNILDYRTTQKILGTYIKGIVSRLSVDNRIRSSYRVIRTGRLASTDPNLQNIKDNADLRKMFVVPKDHVLIDADFSQIELRVLAALCGDTDMCNVYRRGEDLHMETAQAIFEKKDISKDERRAAKAVNFGIVYKETAWGLSKNLEKNGIPTTVEQAEDMITTLFNRFPGILQWQEETIEFAQAFGRVYTMFGRWRELPKATIDVQTDEDERIREAAFRQAVNTPVQGSASDMCLLSARKANLTFAKQKIRARVVNIIHDSIMIEAHKNYVEAVLKITNKIMENEPLRWVGKAMRGIPLLAEFAIGPSWGELEKVEIV